MVRTEPQNLVASFFCCTFAPDLKNLKIKQKGAILLVVQPMKHNLNIQLITAALLALGGLILLFCGMYIEPKGEIEETVLVAFGEVMTFSGSLMGIDYKYKSKYENHHSDP